MRGLGRRRISDGPRGGGPRSGTAAAPVGSTRPSDPMRIGRRSFIRRAVPRAMVALSFIRANVLKRRRSLARNSKVDFFVFLADPYLRGFGNFTRFY